MPNGPIMCCWDSESVITILVSRTVPFLVVGIRYSLVLQQSSTQNATAPSSVSGPSLHDRSLENL